MPVRWHHSVMSSILNFTPRLISQSLAGRVDVLSVGIRLLPLSLVAASRGIRRPSHASALWRTPHSTPLRWSSSIANSTDGAEDEVTLPQVTYGNTVGELYARSVDTRKLAAVSAHQGLPDVADIIVVDTRKGKSVKHRTAPRTAISRILRDYKEHWNKNPHETPHPLVVVIKSDLATTEKALKLQEALSEMVKECETISISVLVAKRSARIGHLFTSNSDIDKIVQDVMNSSSTQKKEALVGVEEDFYELQQDSVREAESIGATPAESPNSTATEPSVSFESTKVLDSSKSDDKASTEPTSESEAVSNTDIEQDKQFPDEALEVHPPESEAREFSTSEPSLDAGVPSDPEGAVETDIEQDKSVPEEVDAPQSEANLLELPVEQSVAEVDDALQIPSEEDMEERAPPAEEARLATEIEASANHDEVKASEEVEPEVPEILQEVDVNEIFRSQLANRNVLSVAMNSTSSGLAHNVSSYEFLSRTSIGCSPLQPMDVQSEKPERLIDTSPFLPFFSYSFASTSTKTKVCKVKQHHESEGDEGDDLIEISKSRHAKKTHRHHPRVVHHPIDPEVVIGIAKEVIPEVKDMKHPENVEEHSNNERKDMEYVKREDIILERKDKLSLVPLARSNEYEAVGRTEGTLDSYQNSFTVEMTTLDSSMTSFSHYSANHRTPAYIDITKITSQRRKPARSKKNQLSSSKSSKTSEKTGKRTIKKGGKQTVGRRKKFSLKRSCSVLKRHAKSKKSVGSDRKRITPKKRSKSKKGA